MQKHDHSLQRFNEWLKLIGVSAASGWRFRERGWIKTLNIGGRLYVSTEQIAQFQRRAAGGEFALRRTPPRHARAEKKKA